MGSITAASGGLCKGRTEKVGRQQWFSLNNSGKRGRCRCVSQKLCCANSGRKPAAFKEWPGMSMEQQQQQQQQQQQTIGQELTAAEDTQPLSEDGLFQTENFSEPFMPLPSSLFQRPALQPGLTTLIEDRPLYDNVQSTDRRSRDCSGSAVRVSTPSISHPLRADWSACSSSNLSAAYRSSPGLPPPPPMLPCMVPCSRGQHPPGLPPSVRTHIKGVRHSTGELCTSHPTSSPLANHQSCPMECHRSPRDQRGGVHASPFLSSGTNQPSPMEGQPFPMDQQKAAHAGPLSSGPGMPLVLGAEPGESSPSVRCKWSKTLPVLSSPLFSILEPLSSNAIGEYGRAPQRQAVCKLDRYAPGMLVRYWPAQQPGGLTAQPAGLCQPNAKHVNIRCVASTFEAIQSDAGTVGQRKLHCNIANKCGRGQKKAIPFVGIGNMLGP
eukprot:1159377-Pelagomonas_calceolata.AAC.2